MFVNQQFFTAHSTNYDIAKYASTRQEHLDALKALGAVYEDDALAYDIHAPQGGSSASKTGSVFFEDANKTRAVAVLFMNPRQELHS